MSDPDFSQVNKTAAKSFNVQKRLIRDLCMGKDVICPVCNKKLVMIGPSTKPGGKPPGIYCDKGCTKIELEFDGE
jgi:hypothetical protein